MKQMKTYGILLLFLLLIFCSACSNFTSEQPSNVRSSSFTPTLDTNKEVFLNVVGEYANFEALEQVVMDFNKIYPNVTITYEMLTDVENTLPKRCVTGDRIDLMFIRCIDFESNYSIAMNHLLDLNTIDIDFSVASDDILSAGKVDGKQLLFPVFFTTSGFLVNESLLKKYGYNIPKTYHEFRTICDAFSKKGTSPILAQESLVGDFFVFNTLGNIMEKPNREKLFQDFNQGIFPKELTEAGREKFQEMKENEWIHKDSDTLPDEYNAVILRFLEGDIPFAIATVDTASGIQKRESRVDTYKKHPFSYTFISVPSEKYRKTFLEEKHFFGVYKESKNLDYAKEFMRFLTTKEELNTLATIKKLLGVSMNSGNPLLHSLESQDIDQFYFSGSCGLSKTALSTLEEEIKANISSVKKDSIKDGTNK